VNKTRFLKGAMMLLALPAFAADSTLVVDRGLPQINLNNSSGPVRSNVRWGWNDHGFLGDSFTVGRAGERWVIDSIRTWAVPGSAGQQPNQLGDFYQDIRLYFGKPTGDLTPLRAASLTAGSNDTGSPDIQITDASQGGAPLYDDFGTSLRVWQVDFSNLNLVVEGGVAYHFGVWGSGRPVPGSEGKSYEWFNHASNAALSGAAQDSADNVMLLFDAGGRYQGTFNTNGSGWDKSSDINVQVFAHPVRSSLRVGAGLAAAQ